MSTLKPDVTPASTPSTLNLNPVIPATTFTRLDDTVLFQFSDRGQRKERSAKVIKVISPELVDVQVAFGPDDLHPSKPASVVKHVGRNSGNDPGTNDSWARC